ncbi:MAG: P63C domain-containing protein [Rhodospirillaceae bacterium]|nr:P63C domain-containing protein [Rhodospirillaceae bacterium]
MAKPLKVIAGAPDKPLIIGGIDIPCYVLEDETRVLSQRGIFSGLGAKRGGGRGGAEIPRILASKTLSPFVSSELAAALKSPIEFQPPGGGRTAYGYPATLLVEICNVYLKAREAGALLQSQMHIADQAELIVRGLATVGITALVDEATGYQRIRAERALADILEAFIAKNLQPWHKTFPYEFYEELYRLRGWDGPDGHKRTHQVGKDTNDLVYARLAPGVLEELQRLNPALPGGGRKWRHHQWFTPDPGYIKLNQHIAGVMALMRATPKGNWTKFYRSLQRAYPKLRDQLDFDFGDG